MASFEHEAAIARRLLEALALPHSNVADPKRVHGRETGADVQFEYGGRTVGVQVTEFTADEGTVHPERGLRATEKRNAAEGKFPPYWIPLQQQRAALKRRVAAKVKIASRHDFEEFAEVWLLVAASVAGDDRVASTFIVPPALSSEGLNDDLDDKLRQSKYSRAFVHLHVVGVVYGWTPRERWCLIVAPPPDPQPPGDLWFKKLLRDPALMAQARPHPKVVEMECGDCGGPFVRKYPRREVPREDGRYVHADRDWCAHIRRVTTRMMPRVM